MNAPVPVVAPAAHDAIAAEIARRAGLGDRASLGKLLRDATRERRRALGLASDAEYCAFLMSERGAGEWQALIEAVTIGETSFFRYPAQWQALREVILPDLRARRGGRPLRIWCAGCSTGAEPYTLSIVLRREQPAVDFEIVGADISAARLEKARRGVFSEWDLRAMAPSLRDACFTREGDGWRLRDAYRRGVEFRRQNLVDVADGEGAPTGAFDIVMCRNVLIYFDAALGRRLLRRLHAALDDGGWYLTGHAEPYLEIARLFHPVAAPGATLYRKHLPTPATGIDADAAAPPAPAVVPCPGVHAAPTPTPPAPPPVRPAPPRPAPRRRPADAPGAGLDSARALIGRGRWRDAAACAARLADRDTLDPEAHFLHALALTHLSDPAGAEAAFGRALYLDPDFALAHYHLGMAAMSRRRWSEAARCFRNVLASLRHAAADAPVRAGDGVAAGELRRYARLPLEALPERAE